MNASQQLRGRANAFKADMDFLSAKIDSHGGSEQELKSMQQRWGGYRIVIDELRNLADEMEREGS